MSRSWLIIAFASLVFAASIGVVAPATVSAGGDKVAIIVGPDGSRTTSDRTYADRVAKAALAFTSNVVKVYSPDATWSKVKSALSGAAVVVYFGRTRGWPSRYSVSLNRSTEDGFGLNPSLGHGNYAVRYYGETYIRTAKLAHGATVLLLARAYATGAGEPGGPAPSTQVARKRVDSYAVPFISAGAGAVVADVDRSVGAWYVRELLGTSRSLDAIWDSAPDRNGHIARYKSFRMKGGADRVDPEHRYSGYTRSLVLRPKPTAAIAPPPSSITPPTTSKSITVGKGKVGLLVTTSGTVIDGYHITGGQATSYNQSEIGIYVEGTPSHHLQNIVIKNCEVERFGNAGIWLQYVDSFTIDNCYVHNTVYAGIEVMNGTSGVIESNTVNAIGVVGYQTMEMNSYGITVTDFGLGVPSKNVRVVSNYVSDVPQWHCIDTHGGQSIVISNNSVRQCNRGIFLTTSSGGQHARDLTVSGNTLSSPTRRVDMSSYPYNEDAITVYAVDGVTGSGNHFDGWPTGNEVSVSGGSTSVSITGSVITNSVGP